MKILDARKIWDEVPHNAFTDLIRFSVSGDGPSRKHDGGLQQRSLPRDVR